MMSENPIKLHDHELVHLKAGEELLIVRPVEPQPTFVEPAQCAHGDGHSGLGWYFANEDYPEGGSLFRQAPHAPGDVLAVQEEWRLEAGDIDDPLRLTYRDGESQLIDPDSVQWETLESLEDAPWRSAKTMPRWAVRCRLTVMRAEAKQVQTLTWINWEVAGIQSDLRTEVVYPAKRWWKKTYAPLGPEYAWKRNPWVWMTTAAEAAGGEGAD